MIRMNLLVLCLSLAVAFTGSTALAQVLVNNEGTVTLPGVIIDDEGIRAPGVTIDDEGIHTHGGTIKSGESTGSSGKSGEGIHLHRGTGKSGESTGSAVGGPGKRFVTLDLRGTDFSGQDLSGALFESTDVRSANFSKTNLKGAIFRISDARTANFREACLINAQFLVSDLRNADFTNAILIGTVFSVSDMGRAITTGAVYEGPAECPGEQSASRPDLIKADQIKQALSQSTGNKVDLTVNFETDSAKIKSEGHVQIFEIANALKSEELKGSRIRIEGHTDNVGSESYNLDLSYRRAVSVLRALVEEYNVSSGNLEVKGFGEGQPVSSNESAEGRALNRRVTLVNIGR